MNSPSILVSDTPVQASGLEGRVLSLRTRLHSLIKGGPEAPGGSCVDTCLAHHLVWTWTTKPGPRTFPLQLLNLWEALHQVHLGELLLWPQECHPSSEALPSYIPQPGDRGRMEMGLPRTSPRSSLHLRAQLFSREMAGANVPPALPHTLETGAVTAPDCPWSRVKRELCLHILLYKCTDRVWRDTQRHISGEEV